MRFVTSARRVSALLFVAVLSACGSGDGSQQSSTSISTNDVSFSAASPDASTPPAQILTATIDPEAIYVAVLHNGAAIASVTYSLSGDTAQIVVDPASPGGLGAGVFTGTITVVGYRCADPACSRLVSGNSQIVNVVYQIPPVVRFVAPYVGVAATADTAVIRGQGFQKFTVEGVTFGATAATTLTVVSDTEIRASYPALAVETYPVRIQAPSSPGAITSLANLVIVAAPAYVATTLVYPAAVSPVSQIQALRYDAERQALLVAVNGGQILRYAYAGAWGAPTTAAVGSLSDIALSTDGQQLLALAQTALTQIDPATLAAGTVTPAPALAADVFLKNLAVANDGNAVVTTGYNGSSNTQTYLYATRSPAFSQPATAPSMDNSTPGGSADGSSIVLAQGSPALASATGVYRYLAASQTFSVTGVSLNQNSIAPALDRAATRIVLNGTNVYDAGYNFLGTLPSTTLAVVVKPDATRAYTFDSAASQVLSFDLTASPAGGAFPQVGATAPAGDPGTGVRMAISPDGGTLFLAGNNQIAVQPAPP